MPALRTFVIDNTARLRSQCAEWDDLWQRSACTYPNMRAHAVAQWVDHFAPHDPLRVLCVAEGDRLVGALPLVGRTWLGLVTVGDLPSNEWTPWADLLLDESADAVAVTRRLVDAAAQIGWELLWIEAAPLDTPRWQALVAAMQEAHILCDHRDAYRVGRREFAEPWETYRESWSKNHRKNMHRLARKTERDHQATFRLLADPQVDDVEALLQVGFGVEDRSWKGAAGSSLLRNPTVFAYYLEQARHFARQGHLTLAYLEFDGQPVAFAYGWTAKGVFHFFKWGYDEAFHDYSPGQQLVHHLLQELHSSTDWSGIDLAGPLTEATAKWLPTSYYTIGRLVAATDNVLGRALLYAYQNVWPMVRRLRGLDDAPVAAPPHLAPVPTLTPASTPATTPDEEPVGA